VNLVTHQALDRDCRSATVHDFQWAKAERELRDALGHRDEREHQDGLEQHRTRLLRVVLRTADRKARRGVLQQARMVELRGQTDELVLAQAHWALARQASPQPAQQGPVRGASEQLVRPPELQPQALLAPRAWRSVLRARAALQQLEQRWLGAAERARLQAASSRLSPRRPLRPFPLWRWLRQPLLLRLVRGDSCGPFRRHPRGWSSNASSFPLRRTRATGQ